MLSLYLLRSAPIETHDLDTNKRHGFTLFIHMAKLVISMMFNTIAVMILIDSLGPDGSFVASYLSHDDFLLNHLGNVIVSLLTVTGTGLCLLICSLVPEEPLSSWRREKVGQTMQHQLRSGFLVLVLDGKIPEWESEVVDIERFNWIELLRLQLGSITCVQM